MPFLAPLHLVALLAALPFSAPQTEGTRVARASELSAALDAGAEHIILTWHIDATSLAVTDLSDNSLHFLNGGLQTLRPMRGACNTAPADPPADWSAPQCVITTNAALFRVDQGGMPAEVWIDAIFVDVQLAVDSDFPEADEPLMSFMPALDPSSTTLWLSRIGILGVLGGAGIYTTVDTLLLNCTIDKPGGYGFAAGDGAAATVSGGSVRDTGSSADLNRTSGLPQAAIWAEGNGTAVLLQNVFLSGNVVHARGSDGGVVYVDALDDDAFIYYQDDGDDYGDHDGGRPAIEVPNIGAFPSEASAQFGAARAAANDAAAAAGIDVQAASNGTNEISSVADCESSTSPDAEGISDRPGVIAALVIAAVVLCLSAGFFANR